MRFIKAVINFILNIIFPPRCVFCGKLIEPHNSNNHINGGHYPYCESCENKIPYCSDYTCCTKCGKPSLKLNSYGLCKACGNGAMDIYTTKIISVFIYKDIVKASVLRYKLSGKKHYANYYSDIMLEKITAEFSDISFDIVTSAPPTKKRRKSKTDFDHSELIAKRIAKRMNVKYLPCLKKLSMAGHQRGLTYTERVKNLHNNIKLLKHKNVKDKTILLADDVYTTGSTIRECSRVLLNNGAKAVYAVTLATVVKERLTESYTDNTNTYQNKQIKANILK